MTDLPKECRVPDAKWCWMGSAEAVFQSNSKDMPWTGLSNEERAYVAARCWAWWDERECKLWDQDTEDDDYGQAEYEDAAKQADIWRDVWRKCEEGL